MEFDSRPIVWETFQGKKIPVEELDHQHLSNIYYWFMLYHKHKLTWVLKELDTRFNGQLLDYRPHISFKEEIEWLESKGMLGTPTENELMGVRPIIFRGINIGQIRICPLVTNKEVNS